MSYVQGNLVNNDQFDVESAGPNSLAEYTRLTRLIPTNIQKIVSKAKEINQCVEEIKANPGSSTHHQKLHDLQQSANQLCHGTSKQLKEMSNLTSPDSKSERRERRVRIDRLKKDLEAALNSFQNAQNQAASVEKQVVERIRALSTASMEEVSKMPVAYSQGNVQLQQLSPVDMEELQERELELRKLESDIMDVNQIFKDLAALVEEQGEVIDRIEDNVVKAEEKVEKGKQNLEEAVVSKKSARKKKFICAGILVAILVIVIIVIVVTAPKG